MNDEEIIAGLKTNANSAYAWLYRDSYPSVKQYILENSGSEADAEDIFQDTLLVLHKKVMANELVLTAALKTYLFSVSKNLWLNRLRERKRTVNSVSETHAAAVDEVIIREEARDNLLFKLARAIQKMTGHCKSLILDMFFRRKKIEDITAEQHYKNVHTARNQKYKCLEQARKEFEK